MNKWIGTLVAVLLTLATSGWHLAGEVSTAKQKIATLEERLKEDRKDTREAISEVKEHVKIIDGNVQIILQKITAIEAVQRAARRERGQ